MDTKRGFKGHAEPPFKEKIKELIENGTLKKRLIIFPFHLLLDFFKTHPLICGYMYNIFYLSVTWMEREIHSREVPHAKAVAKSFEKPCAKSKFTILITVN